MIMAAPVSVVVLTIKTESVCETAHQVGGTQLQHGFLQLLSARPEPVEGCLLSGASTGSARADEKQRFFGRDIRSTSSAASRRALNGMAARRTSGSRVRRLPAR